MSQPSPSPDPPLDTLYHLDDLIQQLLRNQQYLSKLLDQIEDAPLKFAHIFSVYGRNAVYLSRLFLDRHALTSATDSFTDILDQALDQLSVDLDLPL